MAKYILLECNRLRSKEINKLLGEEKDEFKNTWINNVSPSGIVINVGDQITVEQVIVNSRGASDEVMEFNGSKNEIGFLDNKAKLTYSFYVNSCNQNSVRLPLFYHNTFTFINIKTSNCPRITNHH